MSDHAELVRWVDEVARTTRPEKVVYCDGSAEEYRRLVALMVKDGTLLELDPRAFPGCYLHRSHPSDVARTEHRTFICSARRDDAGPTNNWMSPAEARERVLPLFAGAMRGRTLYVVPYLLGPAGSPMARVGVEITDSPYVVASMRIMTRMGAVALQHLGAGGPFVKGMHSLGDLSPERRFICHFPAEREIWSIGSGYGGNALLGKKCFALRIGSVMGRDEGWLAEHMLIVGIEDPEGNVTYVAGAFPSSCGKTNLAMLVPAAHCQGYKVHTVGDDICWMRPGPDGRLWAVNPENGFFGVAPGTGEKTNPNAMAMVRRNCLFTNVALTPDRRPYWEGMGPPPLEARDWRGQPWTPASKDKAAHPNARFTAPLSQCPSISPAADAPQGVPISAILFGGRRAKLAPLVVEATSWQHGVFLGATMASETTAAATGAVGVVRNDPMAMVPFCGYNVADYFRHWLDLGARAGAGRLPRVFHVNWFRTDEAGRHLWPGYGENVRVLKWILGRVRGDASARAVETPLGLLPARDAIDTGGLTLVPDAMDRLLYVGHRDWLGETERQQQFFEGFAGRLPEALWKEHAALRSRLGA